MRGPAARWSASRCAAAAAAAQRGERIEIAWPRDGCGAVVKGRWRGEGGVEEAADDGRGAGKARATGVIAAATAVAVHRRCRRRREGWSARLGRISRVKKAARVCRRRLAAAGALCHSPSPRQTMRLSGLVRRPYHGNSGVERAAVSCGLCGGKKNESAAQRAEDGEKQGRCVRGRSTQRRRHRQRMLPPGHWKVRSRHTLVRRRRETDCNGRRMGVALRTSSSRR